MNSLFVIGNGFDLGHELKTSYEHFHEYLQDKYPDSNCEEFIQPEVVIMNHGEEACKEVDCISFLMRIIANTIGDEWNDIETTLGVLDFSEWFDYLEYELDREGDIDFWKQAYLNEDIASNLVLPSTKITEYFSEWIDTIEIDNISPKWDFVKLVDRDSDFFLTFNYTKTLELIYHVKNICHIHGEQGGELLFGHGNDNDHYEDNKTRYIGSENSLKDIHERLRKNTTKAINDNQDFFNCVSKSVDKIYSYGFSFSKVDKIYIQEICNRVSTDNITWYLHDHEDVEHRQRYKEVIKTCGFRGKFSTYHIS